jgi:two-component sensor histidine kinase
MTRVTDFGSYIKSLCANLDEIQGSGPGGPITLTCESEAIPLDLDVVTALGIVVAELVSNSYDHAFPGGSGAITVSTRRMPGDTGDASMIIQDDGIGFTAPAGSKRHGLGLVRRLIEQVSGTVTLDTERGTLWTISFPTASVQLTPS